MRDELISRKGEVPVRLSLPLAIVLALIANLIPSFGGGPNLRPTTNDRSPQAPK